MRIGVRGGDSINSRAGRGNIEKAGYLFGRGIWPVANVSSLRGSHSSVGVR